MLFSIARSSALLVAALVASAAPLSAASIGMLGVEVTNRSEPQLCAEKDNVTLELNSGEVKQFRIDAAHPSYIDTLQRDAWSADWTACDHSADPVHAAPVPPQKVTIYEDVELWVTGYTFPAGFWRPATVPVRVGNRVETGFHVIQVWVRHNERAEEVLVLYPPDGYWRARPLPPQHLAWSAYGSSFLVGPIDNKGRPFVDLKEVEFDPKTKTFDLKFAAGGSAQLVLSTLDRNKLRLDVTFDKPISDRPFAALRSMYVTRFNNDVAEVAVLEKDATSWREEDIMSFSGADAATDIWTGRHVPSRHNTSSPDMVFSAFSDGTLKPREWKDPTKDKAFTASSPSPAQK